MIIVRGIFLACTMVCATTIMQFTSDANVHYILNNIILFGLGIRKVHIYGIVDPRVKVFPFNSPSLLDSFIMNNVIPDSMNLNQKCTLTRNRILNALKNNSTKRICVSLHPVGGGISKGDHITQVNTLPFTLERAVQPIILVYDHCPTLTTWTDIITRFLPTPFDHPGYTVSAYVLPPMKRKKTESVRQFTDRTTRIMNRVLVKAWEKSPELPYEDEIKLWADRSLLFTSLTFITVVAHAFWNRSWRHGFLWFCLFLTSIIHHSRLSRHPSLARMLDKLMIYLVIGSGIVILYGTTSIIIHILSMTTFVATICIRVLENRTVDPIKASMYHRWLHITAVIGHHILLFGI